MDFVQQQLPTKRSHSLGGRVPGLAIYIWELLRDGIHPASKPLPIADKTLIAKLSSSGNDP